MCDRLMELICEAKDLYPTIPLVNGCKPSFDYFVADHLYENGVIVPPMKLGQTCFTPHSYLNEVDECRVSSITQKADGTFKLRLTNLRGKWVFEITVNNIGKTVFLTREEAEAALKGRESDGRK